MSAGTGVHSVQLGLRSKEAVEGVDLTVAGLGGFLVLAGVIGGGLKLLGQEIPVLNTPFRQGAVFCAGLVVLLVAWGTRTEFRIVDASIQADQIAVTLCPARVSYTGIIEVAGGAGTVEYRFVHNGQPQQTERLEFQSSGSTTVKGAFDLISLPGLPALGPDTAYIDVLTPDRKTSVEAQIPRLC